MTISYPRSDILTLVGIAPPFTFDLLERQEISTLSDARSLVRDYGPSLWFASYTTEEMRNDVAVDYQAVINSLNGAMNPFEAWDMRRPWPRLYPNGVGANDGGLLSVNSNNRAIALSGLNPAQVVSRGDYLSFTYGSNRALHQAMETVTADNTGKTPQFEVRPFLRPGWTLATGVNLKAPRGLFTLTPLSKTPVQTRDKFCTVAFKAGQFLT